MSAEIYEQRKELHGIISQNNFEFIKTVNGQTRGFLGREWAENVRKNKSAWRKHQKLRNLLGLGKNKAVIGIGAGPSFHKNKNILKHVVNTDGVKSWEDRNFITIASNHQFKPLLNMGIIPDFVLLVDGSDVVMDQLNKDIPKEAKNVQLITGVHAHPRVVKEWDRQGRGIVFYTTFAPEVQEAVKKHMKRECKTHEIELGGNVINGAFMIGCGVLKSTVFMCVGNDLSFEINDNIEEQKKKYYADGDYSTNAKVTGTGRDEGQSPKRWGGFSMSKRKIIRLDELNGTKKRYNFELEVVGTSHTLWVYKTWLECTMMGQTGIPVYLHYFNCSEGGILGVMAKDDGDNALTDPSNWYLLDEVCINKQTGKQMYMTAMLEDAVEVYLKARREQVWSQGADVRGVISGAATG